MIALVAAMVLASAAPAPLAISHVSVIDVNTGRIHKGMTVLLAEGNIKAIGKDLNVGPAQVVDGSGKFLIPGLWDMHVHCDNAPDYFFPLFLANGVTGIRDMFGPLEALKTCRTNLENGSFLGPRIVFSGPIVDGPKPAWPGSIAVATPEAGRRAVENIQTGGGDFVKVYSGLPRAAYFALAAEAKQRRISFAGHVPEAITALEASEAGQKSFEHLQSVLLGCSGKEEYLRTNRIPGQSQAAFARAVLDSYDPRKAAALFARFRKNGTWQCPTLTVLNSLAHQSPPVYDHDPRLACMPDDLAAAWNPTNKDYLWKGFSQDTREALSLCFGKQCEVVGQMARAGVGILAGTDTPNPGAFPGYGIHDELALMVKCGLTPRQALQTATINPARFFGWEKKIGTVDVGKVADLVLLDANPLEDIHNTAKIAAVIVRGRLIDRNGKQAMCGPVNEATVPR